MALKWLIFRLAAGLWSLQMATAARAAEAEQARRLSLSKADAGDVFAGVWFK